MLYNMWLQDACRRQVKQEQVLLNVISSKTYKDPILLPTIYINIFKSIKCNL